MQHNSILNPSFEENIFEYDSSTGINNPPTGWIISHSALDLNNICNINDARITVNPVADITGKGGQSLQMKIEYPFCQWSEVRVSGIIKQSNVNLEEISTLSFYVKKDVVSGKYHRFVVRINGGQIYSDIGSYLTKKVTIDLSLYTNISADSTIEFELYGYTPWSGSLEASLTIDYIEVESGVTRPPYFIRLDEKILTQREFWGGQGAAKLDKNDRYIYLGTGTNPAIFIKFDTQTMTEVANITSSGSYVSGIFLDEDRDVGYFLSDTYFGGGRYGFPIITKVRLSDFIIIDELSIELFEWRIIWPQPGNIDIINQKIYITFADLAYVAKIDLDTFTVEEFAFGFNEEDYWYYSYTLGIDKTFNYGYLGCEKLAKFNLQNMTLEKTAPIIPENQYPSTILLDNESVYIISIYCCNWPTPLAKYDQETLAYMGSITDAVIDHYNSGIIDVENNAIYLSGEGQRGRTGHLSKISLNPFVATEKFMLNEGESYPLSLMQTSDKRYLYVLVSGYETGKIVKFQLGEIPYYPECIIKRDEGIYSKPKYCYVGEGIYKNRRSTTAP